MRQYRRRRRTPDHPSLSGRHAGYDVVRTPFGERIVPRGQGWAEAAKWTLWRALSWVLAIALLLVGGTWLYAHLASVGR